MRFLHRSSTNGRILWRTPSAFSTPGEVPHALFIGLRPGSAFFMALLSLSVGCGSSSLKGRPRHRRNRHRRNRHRRNRHRRNRHGTGTGGSLPTAGNPNGSCSAGVPSNGQPADVSNPTTVIGTGTAASCTFSALKTAVGQGGIITFDCGSAAVTIAVTATMNLPTTKDTVIDGGNKITLDGGHAVQILSFNSANFQATETRRDAAAHRARQRQDDAHPGDPDGARPPCSQGYDDGQGGALYMRDGNLTVIDCDLHRQPGGAARPRHRRRRDLHRGQQARRGDRGQHLHQQQRRQRRRGRRRCSPSSTSTTACSGTTPRPGTTPTTTTPACAPS